MNPDARARTLQSCRPHQHNDAFEVKRHVAACGDRRCCATSSGQLTTRLLAIAYPGFAAQDNLLKIPRLFQEYSKILTRFAVATGARDTTLLRACIAFHYRDARDAGNWLDRVRRARNITVLRIPRARHRYRLGEFRYGGVLSAAEIHSFSYAIGRVARLFHFITFLTTGL